MKYKLIRQYRGATRAQRIAGRCWYPRTLRWLEFMAGQHIYPLENVVCAFAALSPRISWRHNCLALVDLIYGGSTNLGFTYNIHKAKHLLMAENPLVALNSKGRAFKTLAFARAILGDHDAVVLDTWMLNVMDVTKSLTNRQYCNAANSLRRAAALVGERPSDFQAIVWLKVRGNGQNL